MKEAIKTRGLKPRRPILLRKPLGLHDPQSLPPVCWCIRCGKEVYRQEGNLCDPCRKEHMSENIPS